MPRQTRQNQAVLNAIADSGRCLHAAEIWALAKHEVPSLNLSTVYRQLKTLHGQQQISRVELPGEPPRFEAACDVREALPAEPPGGRTGRARRAGQRNGLAGGHDHHAPADVHHHHHFHCTACGRVFVLHACPGPLDALLPAGFTLQRHDLTLHGHCGDCAASPGPRP